MSRWLWKSARWMAVLFLLAQPFGMPAQANLASISARVLNDAALNGSADFLVVLKPQANAAAAASGAISAPTRGTQVYTALRGEAETSQSSITTALRQSGAAYRPFWIVNLVAVHGSASLVEQMAARPDVDYIVSDAPFQVPLETSPNGAAQTAAMTAGVEWNLDWIHAPQVWAQGFSGQGIVYANADTGVQWDHPALKASYRGWNGTSVDHNYSWWDGVRDAIPGAHSSCGTNQIAAPCDDYGHGTHTMGTGVGGLVDTPAGATQIGVAPGAKWISCRNMEGGVGRPSSYLSCFQFFMAPTDLSGNNPDPSKHADVVGNSYDCPPNEQCIDPRVFQGALESMRAAGIFMSVSAGNAGPGCSSIASPPALEPSVFTVGATAYQSNALAGFSSRGPVTVDGSGRMKPELVAPGSSVYSSTPGNQFGIMSGTSMASPHVAGAVALLWSAYPSLRGKVAETEALLKSSATHLSPVGTLCGLDVTNLVPNNQFGYGELDVWAAYQAMTTLFSQPADLSVTMSVVSGSLGVGSPVIYSVHTFNNGPNTASTIKVLFTIPNGMTFVSADGGNSWDCGNVSRLVTCTMGSIANGTPAPDIKIQLKTTIQSVSLQNLVVVSALTGDSNLTNNLFSGATQVSIPIYLPIVSR